MMRIFFLILLASNFINALNNIHRTSPVSSLIPQKSSLFSSNPNNPNANNGFKRSPTENTSNNNDLLRTEARRKKIGPPNRLAGNNGKLKSNEATAATAGRVSVYCVGAGIDLVSLRAHVFRRGFGNQGQGNAVGSFIEGEEVKADLVLARDRPGDEDLGIDDEVLHVSNAPLFIAAEKRNSRNIRDNDNEIWEINTQNGNNNKNYKNNNGHINENIEHEHENEHENSGIKEYEFSKSVGMKDDEDHITDDEWKQREVLLMATQDIFYFSYGCVVMWGLSTREEKAALAELSTFTINAVSDTQLTTSYDTLEYIFDRKSNNQRPIRFDRMRLKSLQLNEKLALSYAMAQSSKLFVFESNVLDSVERTRYLPKELAENGRIDSSKKQLNQRIGELFVEQTEVNLFSSILDTPDFLWDDDQHLGAYTFTRAYLEVDERVALLNSRLAVIRDLLDVLTAQVADSNSTRLEWIIIWLISVEIIMGIASNPLFAGRRVLASSLVPVFIFGYKRINFRNLFKN